MLPQGFWRGTLASVVSVADNIPFLVSQVYLLFEIVAFLYQRFSLAYLSDFGWVKEFTLSQKGEE